MIQELVKIFVYIVVPGLAGITFFALAKFVKQIAPMRALVSSQQTYTFAFWAYFIFGFYLGLRPVQVLAGPHPWPLVISSIREFLLVGIFAPAMFINMMTLCFGAEKINRKWIVAVFGFSLVLTAVCCIANALAMGGSKEIVKLGMLTAYDGLWFKSGRENIEQLMKIIFWVHLLSPGFLLFVGCVVVMYYAKHYPDDKKRLYNNMPKKLSVLSIAFLVYVFSLVLGSFLYGYKEVPDQWDIYHLGSLVAGILETISIAMPVRSGVQVSEHEE